jgi:hypothetical protein
MAVDRRNPPPAPSRTPVRPAAPRPSTPRSLAPRLSVARLAAPARPVRPPGPVVRGPRVAPLLLWPALVTLAVTALRLVGELRGWSPEYWSRLPGGGLSPLGITWLAPLVAIYFGWRLGQAGVPAPHPVVTVGVPLLAVSAGVVAALLAGRIGKTGWTTNLAVWGGVSILVAAVVFACWPALGRILLAYAYLARIPVAMVMAFAIWKNWGTHYDVPPPGYPPMSMLRRWLWTGLLPQTTIWVAWTMATGMILAPLGHWAGAWAGARRRR